MNDNTDTVTPFPFRCPKCPKSFLNQAGLNMHNMRVHTGQVLALGQKGFRPNPANAKRKHYPSSDAEVKRRKYQENKARFYAQGLDAKGRPFKSELGRRTSQAMRTKQVRWTPERTAKFRATWRRKLKAKQRADAFNRGAEVDVAPRPSKRIQFVYPTPGTDQSVAEPTKQIRRVRYCPFCGEQIEKHLYETP